MYLNTKQRIVLLVFAFGVILLCVFFVPWIIKDSNGTIVFSSYSPIWEPRILKTDWTIPPMGSVDTLRLIVEIITLIILTGIGLLVTRDKKIK
jgi:hypothetical protein